MNKISLLAISVMAFVGCSIDTIDEVIDEPTAPSSGRELTVAASFGSTSTRVGLAEDESSVWNFTWQSDDMLSACFDYADISNNVPFYIQDGFEGNNADFTGTVPDGAINVVFTYPHRITDFDLRNQIVVFDEESKALNAYGEYHVVLTSKSLAVSDVEEGADIPLSAKYTAIELKITGSTDVSGKITKAIMSYTSGETTTTTKLSVTNSPEISPFGSIYIPFSYEPFTTAAGDSFTVTCIFDNGKVATFIQNSISEGVEFAAGTHNYMSVSLDDYTTTGVNSGEISSYSATQVPNADIWVVTDSEISSKDSYTGLKDALDAANTAGRTIEVVFPNLTTVVASAFNSFSSLTSISLPVAITLGERNFYSCSSLTSISTPKATDFGDYAFYNCSSLTSISLPAATTFGFQSFRQCSKLTSISLPAATTFGVSSFLACTKLTNISLPAATTFGNYAFNSCTSLTSLSLGEDCDGIISIGTDFCCNVTTSNINLTIKLAEGSNCSISGNTLTVTNSDTPAEYTFKSITQKF